MRAVFKFIDFLFSAYRYGVFIICFEYEALMFTCSKVDVILGELDIYRLIGQQDMYLRDSLTFLANLFDLYQDKRKC